MSLSRHYVIFKFLKKDKKNVYFFLCLFLRKRFLRL
jgi:hypothetical protein